MYVSFILKVIICTNKRSEPLKYTVGNTMFSLRDSRSSFWIMFRAAPAI
jgi:hypothetical protein